MSSIKLTDSSDSEFTPIQFFTGSGIEGSIEYKPRISIASSVLVESTDDEINNTSYRFIFYNKKKSIVRLQSTSSNEELAVHLLDPQKQHGITKIQIISEDDKPDKQLSEEEVLPAPVADIIDETAQPIDSSPEEIIIDIENIEESDTILYKEANIWELSYKSDTLIEDIIEQLSDYYEHKNINKSVDILRLEAVSILDLINKYKVTDDITNKTPITYGPDYKPLLDKILTGDFSNSYILPIIFDQKKIYSQDDDIVAEDHTTINHETELQILNEIMSRYREKKNNEFTNHSKVLDTIYNGGNIELTPGERTFFDGIYRSHTNTEPKGDDNVLYYKTHLKNDTKVYRYCFNDAGCDKIKDVIMASNIGNVSEGEDSVKLQISTRLADGELLILKDVYDDRYISDTKGEVKSCSSVGDRYYTGNDKSSDLNKTISKSPEYVKYVNGEDVNIVGFVIKAISCADTTVINGNQIIKNGGEVKQYSQMYNSGLTIMDIAPSKKSNKYKIINNYIDFDWNRYNPNYNYVILFNNTDSTTNIHYEDYLNIVKHITPSIEEIFEIEKTNISRCINTDDLGRVLNKHCVHVNQVSKQVFDKFSISTTFIRNALAIKDYDQYIISKLDESKLVRGNYISLHNSLLQFKRTLDNSLETLSHIELSTEYVSKTSAGIKHISDPLFKLHDTDFLATFLADYLHSSTVAESRSEIIDEIILTIITSSSSVYSTSSFTNFFNNMNELIDNEYMDLYMSYLQEFNISINSVHLNHNTNFDKNIINHLDFMASIKRNSNNAHELIEIIDLSNIKKCKQTVINSIRKYGEREYNLLKNKTDVSWKDMTNEQQLEYIPDMTSLKKLNTLARSLRKIYTDQREQMSFFLKKCKNIELKKDYSSIESLNADNSRTIYVDSRYDSTENDLAIWNSLHISDIEHKKIEFKKLLEAAYIFYSSENILNKYQHVIDIINHQSDNELVKIVSGDYAILHEGNRRLLYSRKGSIWVPVDKSQNTIQQCYKYDDIFLQFEFDDIEQHCIDYKSGEEDNRNKCIHSDSNTIITEKLYKLHYLYDNIMNKISNIGSVLKYYQTMDDKIKDKHVSLMEKLDVIRLNNRKKPALLLEYNREPPIIQVYPPRHILNELSVIKRLDDFDQRGIRLKDFISTYGVQQKYVNGKQLPGDNWFYNIENVTVPLLCNHYNKLIDSALMDESIKEANMREVRDTYGILDGEFYYCKNCGEIIDYQKYSEFEGFGNDDKVINVREIVEEEFYEEDIEDIASISLNKITAFTNIVLRKIGINLRVEDYKLIIDTIHSRLDSCMADIYNLKDFYYKYIIPTLKPEEIEKETVIRNQIESIPGMEYTEDFFRNFRIEGISKPILKFIGSFYKHDKESIGNNIKFLKGYRDMHILSYTISTIAEVIRTSIPDYTIQGSGVEKRTKKGTDASGIIISDPYEATVTVGTEEKLWILSYITDLIYSDISLGGVNKLLKPINNFLDRRVSGKRVDRDIKKQRYLDIIDTIYLEISSLGIMRDKSRDKRDHRVMIQLDRDEHITYEWDEFLPSLEFNNSFSFTPPDITSIIREQITNIAKLKTLNKISDSVKIAEITSSIQDNNLTLKKVEGFLSFDLMTKINNIITTRDIPSNFNSISYTGTTNYDMASEDYLNDYIKIDPTISSVRDNMNMITSFFNKYNYNTNIVYDIVRTTHSVRDLQDFMKLDRNLYDDDDDLVKEALISKIRQINYIYNLSEGINYGELRHFKHVTDSDYYMVTDAYASEETPIEYKVREDIQLKYGDQYPIENIEFKLKLLIEYNGTAEIDIISMEFKNDISDKVDKLVFGKSINEINDIISEIEVNTNIIEKITENSHIKIPNEIDNKHIISDRVRSMLEGFTSTCGDDNDIDKSIQSLIDIQTRIYTQQFTDINSDTYMSSINDIHSVMTPYFNFCQKNLTNKIANIARHSLDSRQTTDILSNISRVDEYYNEIINSIDAKLKIEGLTNMTTIEHEKKFRNNFNNISNFSNRVNIHISIIRYIINLLSYFHNRLESNSQPSPANMSFLQEKDKSIVRDILGQANNPNKVVDTVISHINASGEDKTNFKLPSEQFEKISNFTDKLNMFNNSIANTGDIATLYINSPEVMIGFTNTIIIYLIDLLVDEEDVDRTIKLSPMINNITMYIKKTTIVNNITDENIEFILGKHRADQNQSRLKRFQKKDKEEQGLHKIYRQYNLGNQISDDQELVADTSEVGFMTSDSPDTSNQFTMEDGDEVIEDLYDEEGREGLIDTAVDFDIEELEEGGD